MLNVVLLVITEQQSIVISIKSCVMYHDTYFRWCIVPPQYSMQTEYHIYVIYTISEKGL